MEKMNKDPEQIVIERMEEFYASVEASLQRRDELIKLQQEKIDALEKLVALYEAKSKLQEEIINVLKPEENEKNDNA